MHPNFHILASDGIFSPTGTDLLFHEAFLTPDDVADTQEAIQGRVLKYFEKRGFFDHDTVEKMLSYENNGFSLNASVRIAANDRADPEYELERHEICQLVPGTKDGFPEIHSQIHPEIGPDPPWQENFDPPHDVDTRDPPHWEDYSDPSYWDN